MDEQFIKDLISRISSHDITPDEALDKLKYLSFENLGHTRIDHHRALRKGFPEVIYCEGKQPGHILEIIQKMLPTSSSLLATRASYEVFIYIKKQVPEVEYNEKARIIYLPKISHVASQRGVAVLCAGTSDISVAEEAAFTAEYLGSVVYRYYDVGVAGIHRLYKALGDLHEKKAGMIIAVAGMEGALPGVTAGLTHLPVVAVPTSVGYGTSFNGLTSLFAMLNTCSSGLTVVNIDNGFGAGYFAAQSVREMK